eukprot:COSAG02_NODE_178_length_31091_cov_59.242482_21_plen_140_part_00
MWVHLQPCVRRSRCGKAGTRGGAVTHLACFLDTWLSSYLRFHKRMNYELVWSVANVSIHICATDVVQAPGGEAEDPRKFELTKTLAERFMVCIEDWGVTADTLKAMKTRADAKSTQAEIAAEAAALVPEKYLKGRVSGA